MMSFEEFTEDVLKEIRMKMGDAYQIRKRDMVKNNDVKLTGIEVIKEEANIGPCVYLDEFYRRYGSDGMRLDEIVDEVHRLILKHEEDTPDVDLSGFRNWETVREDIYPKLVNARQSKELLEKIPHRNFMDLAVVYYAVARDHEQKDIGTILIYNGHMERWGQEEDNLYQTAMMNMCADGEADFTDIRTIVERMTGITFTKEDGVASRDTDMYVLTNSHRRFGAAEILDKKIMRMVADKVGDRFIVLPSSVHETLVMPSKDETEYKQLADMVRDINKSLVEAEERLSDHVYVYSRDEETLRIVA
jgi:hypothetical protein